MIVSLFADFVLVCVFDENKAVTTVLLEKEEV